MRGPRLNGFEKAADRGRGPAGRSRGRAPHNLDLNRFLAGGASARPERRSTMIIFKGSTLGPPTIYRRRAGSNCSPERIPTGIFAGAALP